jgi:hypothetical protein
MCLPTYSGRCRCLIGALTVYQYYDINIETMEIDHTEVIQATTIPQRLAELAEVREVFTGLGGVDPAMQRREIATGLGNLVNRALDVVSEQDECLERLPRGGWEEMERRRREASEEAEALSEVVGALVGPTTPGSESLWVTSEPEPAPVSLAALLGESAYE